MKLDPEFGESPIGTHRRARSRGFFFGGWWGRERCSR